MLDFRIETFLAVCKFMNFTKASQYLNITQPAVSGHIRYLEEYYDVKLFCFVGKKMQLTKQGKILLEAATTLKHDDICLKKQLKNTTEQQELIFGVTLSVGEYLMPKIINRLLQVDKNIDLKMEVANTQELLTQMNEGKIDFAIVEGYFNKLGYDYLHYCKEQFVCVGSNDLEDNNVNDISDLFAYPLIVREEGSGSREIIERYLEDHNLRLKDFSSVIEISNIGVIKQLVSQNCGITFIYKMAVEKEIADGTLKIINIRNLSIKHDISFIWRKNSIFSKNYQQLFEQFQLQNDEVSL